MPNYTYDDFTRAADAAGLTGSFDASDLTTAQKYPEYGLSLVSLKRDLGNAQTAEQRLLVNEAMNQLRKNYGSYAVGDAGNRSYAASFGSRIDQALDDIGSYGSYSSPYSDQISQALKGISSLGDFKYSQENEYKNVLDRIIKQQSFSYDPASDPLFSSYKKAYNREGDRAAANALAAAAAATGGRASSYANMAAQQANNYYAGKLADMIPTLRGQALSEYNNEYDQLLNRLNTVATDRATEYQQYLDRLAKMQQNLQNLQEQDATEYGRYADRLSQMQQNLQNLQGQDQSDYNRYLDMLNAEYQRERAAAQDRQDEFDNSLKVYQLTGQITGALADYLGGGSTYSGAAATYTGGGSSGGGRGTYAGTNSKNTPTESAAAAQKEVNSILTKWGTSPVTGEKYTDANGNSSVRVGSWDEYQRLKELGGWSDAELNQAGISYAYPTTTDANGNITPAVAYTTFGGGKQMTWEDVDAAGSNYQLAAQTFETMKNGGASKNDVLAEIRSWYQDGDLTSSDYQRLYNQYRNMNSSEFGTVAATTTPSTSGRATGNGTVKPGTRTPGAATATTPSTSGRATGNGTVKPGTRTPGATTPTTSTTPSSSSGNKTSLASALKNAVQQAAAAAEANPYAGYATDPVSAAQILGTNSSSSSNKSTTPKVDAVTGAAPSVSKPASTTSTGTKTNLLTQLGNALKNAVQQANASAEANPYAGYATDPVSAAQILGTSNSSASSNKSTTSTAKKTTGTVSSGTRTPSAKSTTTANKVTTSSTKTTSNTSKKTTSGGSRTRSAR